MTLADKQRDFDIRFWQELARNNPRSLMRESCGGILFRLQYPERPCAICSNTRIQGEPMNANFARGGTA